MYQFSPHIPWERKVGVTVEGAKNGQQVSWAPAGVGSTLNVPKPAQVRVPRTHFLHELVGYALAVGRGVHPHRNHRQDWGHTQSSDSTCFVLFCFLNKFIYLFLAALGLCCCVRAFSSCSERGLLFVVVCGLLTVVASLVVEHGL